ncbi:hatching enzyme 1.2-like [Littorina saxatilis]|uniref:hatching enzyme 1.2-like n=1 Tax=Littorina saxatilis TaxID=31220 RepID=UPI0038B4B676
MKLCLLLVFIIGLVAGRPEPEPQISVEEIETVDDPEVTEGYFEGDIELPKFRNAIRNLNERWPNGIVYYRISSAFPSSTHATIVEAMREIESNTKHGSTYCVRYVERTTQSDYIYIQKNTGCHSKIGRHGGAQELSLGTGCEGKGTIMHELNHALGFWHEQNRYDRDSYVTIHTDNIASQHQHDFTKHTSNDMNLLGTPYDFGSVMHYGAYTFAVDKSHPSISPKTGYANGVTMGQRLAMSTQDVARIQKLYGCPVDTSHVTHPSSSQSVVKCNFDSSLCGMTSDSQSNFQWTRKSGSTSTPHTGPIADHTNSAGYYIYAEASGHHNQHARLLSQTVAGGHYCIDYWLYQYGSQEGSFQVLAAGSRIREQAVKTVSGSQSNAWKHYRINLNVPADFHIVLQASMSYGDLGDIAIDDLNFYHGRCL